MLCEIDTSHSPLAENRDQTEARYAGELNPCDSLIWRSILARNCADVSRISVNMRLDDMSDVQIMFS